MDHSLAQSMCSSDIAMGPIQPQFPAPLVVVRPHAVMMYVPDLEAVAQLRTVLVGEAFKADLGSPDLPGGIRAQLVSAG